MNTNNTKVPREWLLIVAERRLAKERMDESVRLQGKPSVAGRTLAPISADSNTA